MALDHIRLSPLPDVAAFLVQRAQVHQPLQDALDDGLEDYTEGAEVILTALRALLDEWLEEGRQQSYEVNKDAEPFKWLALSDHLEIVEQFRQLL